MPNITPWCAKDLTPFILEDWLRHDASCASLSAFYFHRKGEDATLGEYGVCKGCSTYFLADGLVDISDEGMWLLCECCSRVDVGPLE